MAKMNHEFNPLLNVSPVAEVYVRSCDMLNQYNSQVVGAAAHLEAATRWGAASHIVPMQEVFQYYQNIIESPTMGALYEAQNNMVQFIKDLDRMYAVSSTINSVVNRMQPLTYSMVSSSINEALIRCNKLCEQLAPIIDSDIYKMVESMNSIMLYYRDFIAEMTDEDREDLLESVENMDIDFQTDDFFLNEEVTITDDIWHQFVSRFPELTTFSKKIANKIIATTITIIQILVPVGCLYFSHQDAVQAHQDAVQAHQDAVQAHKDAVRACQIQVTGREKDIEMSENSVDH
jgi:hypothetical protein